MAGKLSGEVTVSAQSRNKKYDNGEPKNLLAINGFWVSVPQDYPVDHLPARGQEVIANVACYDIPNVRKDESGKMILKNGEPIVDIQKVPYLVDLVLA